MIKKNYKLIVGIIIGAILTGTTVYAATIISSINVGYSNESSKLVADNVQDAIDETYKKLDSYKEYIVNDNPNRNIIKAYKYNEDEESSTYCITGEEKSCFITSCYDNYAKDSCPAGTIIEYKVNENNTFKFYVMFDKGKTLLLQSQNDTINSVAWYSEKVDNRNGPLTLLEALEKETSTWVNVNSQTYEMGKTIFALNSVYTGCSLSLNCDINVYALDSRTAYARVITVQEALALGCKQYEETCPNWMFNNVSLNKGYWTMSARSTWYDNAITIYYGRIVSNDPNSSVGKMIRMRNTDYLLGARAVVEINK